MLQTKFMLIKSDQTKPQSPTRRVTYIVGHDSRFLYILEGSFCLFVICKNGIIIKIPQVTNNIVHRAQAERRVINV